MNRFALALSLFSTVSLAGCATPPGPQARPFTVQESQELALEALNRRGLSFDEYQRKRAELLKPAAPHLGFDRQGEMNADRSAVLRSRPS